MCKKYVDLVGNYLTKLRLINIINDVSLCIYSKVKIFLKLIRNINTFISLHYKREKITIIRGMLPPVFKMIYITC